MNMTIDITVHSIIPVTRAAFLKTALYVDDDEILESSPESD